MATEEFIRRYVDASARNDFDALAAMRHPRWHLDWPQSRERVPDSERYRKIHERFPGDMPQIDVTKVAGAQDQLALSPSMTIVRIAGSGDVWLVEGVNTYSNGDVYYVAHHIELLDGRILRETAFFAPPIQAPEWRAAWVEPIR